MGLDETHLPSLRSWVHSANEEGTPFPVQNLPFARFRRAGSNEQYRTGVAIGDQVIDLGKTGLVRGQGMEELMGAPAPHRRELRLALSRGLRLASRESESWRAALVPQEEVEYTLPCRIGGYTDFYTGIHHATNVGRLFRPDQPLLPNYKWVPIGYHGRTSSIRVSGAEIRRPAGQYLPPGSFAPQLLPTARLDYELELGFFAGMGNERGCAIPLGSAEDHLFGVCLLNDWSARDVQAWEYQPLGPFLSKNFATSISPWVVTMDALAPFRAPRLRPEGDPLSLPYLHGAANEAQGALSVQLEVWIQTSGMKALGLPPHLLSEVDASAAAYWTPAQLVAHHTVNGCNLEPGDLLGSGTLSGPSRHQAGSLLELSFGGKTPVAFPGGDRRAFLEDGDTVIFRGHCRREGVRSIGLGEVRGTVAASNCRP